MRRRVLAIVALALLAGATSVGVWLGSRDASVKPGTARAPVVPGGPLAYPPGTRSEGYFPVALGRPYTWGEILLRNSGRIAVRIDRVELIDPSPGLVVLGTRAVRPTSGLVGFTSGYESTGFPVDGLVIPPGRDEEFELLLGLRIDAPGTYRIHGARVHYHDALNRYVARFDQIVAMCGPAERYTTEERCRRGS